MWKAENFLKGFSAICMSGMPELCAKHFIAIQFDNNNKHFISSRQKRSDQWQYTIDGED